MDDVNDGVDAQEWPGDPSIGDVDETGGEGEGAGDNVLLLTAVVSPTAACGEGAGKPGGSAAVTPREEAGGKYESGSVTDALAWGVGTAVDASHSDTVSASSSDC